MTAVDLKSTSQTVTEDVDRIERMLETGLSLYCSKLNKLPMAVYVYKLRMLLDEIKAAPE